MSERSETSGDGYGTMTIGPITGEGGPEHTGGNVCVACGGDECGLHPAGCVYGGPTELTGYWLIVEGCELSHD